MMSAVFSDFLSSFFLLGYGHVCVLNRHAVRYSNNAAQSVDSTHMRVIVFFKRLRLCACSLGLFLHCSKVVEHAASENHTHECENHTH
jgi:hypothetical protein